MDISRLSQRDSILKNIYSFSNTFSITIHYILFNTYTVD